MSSLALDENLGLEGDFSRINNVGGLWNRFQRWRNDRKAKSEAERQAAIAHLRYLENKGPKLDVCIYLGYRRSLLEDGGSLFFSMLRFEEDLRRDYPDFVSEMEEKGVVIGDFSTTPVRT